jgi:hypothetical protein
MRVYALEIGLLLSSKVPKVGFGEGSDGGFLTGFWAKSYNLGLQWRT